MGKLRLLFMKEGRSVYISHLDLMRTFQRVFLREGIALRHSQGFHPHPVLSIALPLSVGQSSQCEMLDFETVEDLEGAELVQRLNRSLPDGLRVRECYVPAWPIRELEKLRCRVELLYDGGVSAGAAEAVGALLTGERVLIQKRTKRKALAEIDIRPMLHSLEIAEEPGLLRLDVVVAAQNPGLNPASLAAAVEAHLPRLAPDFVRIRRLETLDGAGERFR